MTQTELEPAHITPLLIDFIDLGEDESLEIKRVKTDGSLGLEISRTSANSDVLEIRLVSKNQLDEARSWMLDQPGPDQIDDESELKRFVGIAQNILKLLIELER